MKKLLFFSLVLLACGSTSQNTKTTVYANKYNFSQHKGKVIQSMRYCDGCEMAGDLLIIEFTDGTKVNVYAYKYDMQIK